MRAHASGSAHRIRLVFTPCPQQDHRKCELFPVRKGPATSLLPQVHRVLQENPYTGLATGTLYPTEYRRPTTPGPKRSLPRGRYSDRDHVLGHVESPNQV